ncbi:MAG: PorT protein [Cytophagaceae bacterium]|nr:PorT protein [Cytophagaceae bacterium]|tara:strand:- start:530 stop:1228 length:699 start_codon:yes stop_codon:yes gene_type:complete
MKKILFLLALVCLSHSAHAQLFAREKLTNLENFDKQRWSWGYYFGLNKYDFKFVYDETKTKDVYTNRSTGFNVGLVGDLRLNDYMNLRLEPGLYYTTRDLEFPGFQNDEDALREVKSTYIHIPLLLKVSTKRLNNIKPFIIGGFSYSNNLSSNQDNPDDNSAGQFRMKTHTLYYEVGFGVDMYLYFFKFTPSIRGVFALTDELVRDADPNSAYTGNIEKMMSRGVFLNFTFQ